MEPWLKSMSIQGRTSLQPPMGPLLHYTRLRPGEVMVRTPRPRVLETRNVSHDAPISLPKLRLNLPRSLTARDKSLGLECGIRSTPAEDAIDFLSLILDCQFDTFSRTCLFLKWRKAICTDL